MKQTRERLARVPSTPWSALAPSEGGKAALPELDPIIHERTRLLILTTLSASVESALSFLDLRNTLHLTDGNLMAHLRTLQDAELVELTKTGAGRGSTTLVRLTAAGQSSFRAYLNRLEALLRAARGAEGNA